MRKTIHPAVVAVSRRFLVSPRQLTGPGRSEPVASYRLLGMALAHEMGATFLESARAFGRTNHATAMHAYQVVRDRCAVEIGTARQWLELLGECGSDTQNSGK